MYRTIPGLIFVLLLATIEPISAATTAYVVPANTAGNQAWGGSLGMDFNVNQAIVVTELGVFDAGSDGLVGSLNTRVWNRATATQVGPTSTFSAVNPGVLEGGSRFKPLGGPIVLGAGFEGRVGAGGFSAGDQNGNGLGGVPVWTTNTGGGLISFTGSSYFGGDPNGFPSGVDGGPANRYAAGTFRFEAADIAYQIAAGTAGNQNYGGALGMDFDVNRTIMVTHVGVFDDGSNGINGSITAKLWQRNGTGGAASGVGAHVTEVFSGSSDVLIGGQRFRALPQPIFLNKGFTGTMAAGGYNASELNGNSNSGPFAVITYDGGGEVSFVGASRYGATPVQFPDNSDTSVAQYGAGTFWFSGAPITLKNPTASFEQGGLPVTDAIDTSTTIGFGNAASGWAVAGAPGSPQAVFQADETTLGGPGGSRLTFYMDFNSQYADHVMDNIRLSVTDVANPDTSTASWTTLSLVGASVYNIDGNGVISGTPLAGTSLNILPGNVLQLSGNDPGFARYIITAYAPLPNITGFRIEAGVGGRIGSSISNNFVLTNLGVVQAVPEPSSLVLVAVAVVGLIRVRRKSC